ncbi:tyrosine-type recombinase/integrase [Mesorhizobium sp. INR15]|uniref:tyrosine-type recombinase/integrase n=1 Tax=Mesorhizobium sp. INR15 TaxID=2654248 RepID=UPI0018969611|nr:tyrosine-type recombinase/integrase [Mesorhizobium sp. INR15]QPC92602.1 tyrosine-type recombinase/integrase [Mesorhizobium sp. INR15]
MTTPHLKRSPSGAYHYRFVVPEAFRDFVGRREIKKALGKDPAEAMRLYARVHRETELLLKNAKTQAPPGDRALVLRRMRQMGFSPQDIEIVSGHRVEPASYLDEGLSIFQDELIREYEDAEERGKSPALSLEAIRAIGQKRLPKETYTVASALDDYLSAKSTGVHARDLALTNRVNKVKERLISVIGKHEITKRPLEKLTRAEALSFRDHLAGEMAPASVKRTIEIVSPAINNLIQEHTLDVRNPFAQLKIKGAANSRDARLPLHEEDMIKLAPVMEKGDASLVAIWIALRDTGARLGEVCNLRRMDVDEDAECIRIRPYGDHTLKTKNSARNVPLSPTALSYLKSLADGLAPEDTLFGRYAGPRKSETASAALMKRLRTVVTEKKKTIHSLRHRMKDLLRNTSCPESLAQEIMGHSAQTVADNYGEGPALRMKREALEKAW